MIKREREILAASLHHWDRTLLYKRLQAYTRRVDRASPAITEAILMAHDMPVS